MPSFKSQSCVENFQTNTNVVANNPTICESRIRYYLIAITSTFFIPRLFSVQFYTKTAVAKQICAVLKGKFAALIGRKIQKKFGFRGLCP